MPLIAPATARTLTILIGVVLSVALAWLYVAPEWASFVIGDHVEYGDFANNALRIRDAKTFHEIYGNFSRYGFYHPGPAFWYLYAAGEYVFHDWLGVISSAPFAHILTGTLFQCACAVAAILYLARRTSLVIVPLSLAILLVHWHLFRGAPTSVWPPHVLFGPYLLLIVFASGVAAGSLRALPVMIFAGGMLVHGHVAQPLQVVPVGLLAFAGCWRARGGFAKGDSDARPYIVASLILVALFLLPLAVDLARGAPNFTTILTHLQGTGGDRHSLAQGAGYFLGFFRYEITQETVQGAADFALGAYLADHWASWILPLMCMASGGVLLFLKNTPLQIRRFVQLVFVAVVLSVMWGVMQDGGMYEFNGNYIYAVVYIVYLLPAILLSVLIEKAPARMQYAVGVVAAAAMLWAATMAGKPIVMAMAPSDDFNAGLRRLIGDAVSVHVVIEPERWIAGYAAVTALERMGVNVAVDPVYKFLRGERPPSDALPALTLTVSTVTCADGVPVPAVPQYGVGQEMVCVTGRGM